MLSRAPSPAKALARVADAEAALTLAVEQRDALIRDMAANGSTVRALADDFNLSSARIGQIVGTVEGRRGPGRPRKDA